MAEGLCRELYGDIYEPYSAGTAPEPIRSQTIQVMDEVGVDIHSAQSKSIELFREKSFDMVVTLCDKAKGLLPFVPEAQQYYHIHVPDPANAIVNVPEEYRKTRKQIEKALSELLTNN